MGVVASIKLEHGFGLIGKKFVTGRFYTRQVIPSSMDVGIGVIVDQANSTLGKSWVDIFEAGFNGGVQIAVKVREAYLFGKGMSTSFFVPVEFFFGTPEKRYMEQYVFPASMSSNLLREPLFRFPFHQDRKIRFCWIDRYFKSFETDVTSACSVSSCMQAFRACRVSFRGCPIPTALPECLATARSRST